MSPIAARQHQAIPSAPELTQAGFLAVVASMTLFGPLPLALVGSVAFVVLAARDRVWPLCLIIVSLPFSPLSRSVGPYALSPTEIFIVLSAIGAVVDTGIRIVRPLRASRTAATLSGDSSNSGPFAAITSAFRGDRVTSSLVLLLVVFAGLSLTASVAKHESIQSFRVVVLEPATFFFLAMRTERDRRIVVYFAVALVLAGVLISLVGFWQYLNDERIITAEADLRRIRGFYGSPNNLGLFLGRSIPVGVALALWSRRARGPLVLASAAMVGALTLTFSIGAWVAVAASVALVAVLRGRPAVVAALLVGIVAAAVVAVAAVSVPRIGSHFDLQSGTSSIRLDVWTSGARMVVDHPLRGIGLDNFLYYYQHGYRLPTAWQDPNLSHPHNLILDFWLSLGLPGLLLLGALLARFVTLARRTWNGAEPIERGLIAGASGALADILIHGFVDNSFFLPDLAVLFLLMFVIVVLISEAAVKSLTA